MIIFVFNAYLNIRIPFESNQNSNTISILFTIFIFDQNLLNLVFEFNINKLDLGISNIQNHPSLDNTMAEKL